MPRRDHAPGAPQRSSDLTTIARTRLSFRALTTPHAGLIAEANDHARVVFTMQGLSVGGTAPEASLGFAADAVEDFIEELRNVVAVARAQEANWQRCEGCGEQVRVGKQTWPDCAADCAE